MRSQFSEYVLLFLASTIFLFFLPGCGGLESETAKELAPAFGEKQTNATTGLETQLTQEAYFQHTVKWNGETLSIIAGWYTGTIQNWELLVKHNPHLDPNKIFIGNIIRIPKSEMTTKEPMPKEFLKKFYPEKEKTGDEKPSETLEEEPELFGPKPLQER